MLTMTWDPSFVTGIKTIDQQHRQLFQVIAELHQELHGPHNLHAMREVVKGLAHYIRTHFTYEEGLMAEHGFPDLAPHQAQHVHFVRKVEEFERMLQEKDPQVDREISAFLRQWLSEHILGTDKHYVTYLKERGIE